MKSSIIICYENTKGIEDFALTPFIIIPFSRKAHIYGIGISWGFWSIAMLIVKDKPKGFGIYVNSTRGKEMIKQLKEE